MGAEKVGSANDFGADPAVDTARLAL